MTDRATTEVGQLRLVDGVRQEPPANLGVAERRADTRTHTLPDLGEV